MSFLLGLLQQTDRMLLRPIPVSESFFSVCGMLNADLAMLAAEMASRVFRGAADVCYQLMNHTRTTVYFLTFKAGW
jgi:hypothetical protein